MAHGTDIRTWLDGDWHEGNPAILRAADQATWLGTLVFDGARMAYGVAPDLDLHCARANASARALGFEPVVSDEALTDICREGLKAYDPEAAIYVRPMLWPTEPDAVIGADPSSTRMAVCLERVPMPPDDATTTLTRTRFRRPTLETAVVSAKAACLYPNNARMMMEARSKGFGNALVTDANGNVAESATANVFMVRDGEVLTPVANGTFLAGITRARHMKLLAEAGMTVREATLTYEDFEGADEVFLTGNLAKITPVTAFDDVTYQAGPVARRARELYWEWARSGA